MYLNNIELYKEYQGKSSNNEKDIRESLGLPITKQLIYYEIKNSVVTEA